MSFWDVSLGDMIDTASDYLGFSSEEEVAQAIAEETQQAEITQLTQAAPSTNTIYVPTAGGGGIPTWALWAGGAVLALVMFPKLLRGLK